MFSTAITRVLGAVGRGRRRGCFGMSQDPITAWLTAFDRLVSLRGRARRRARAELEGHLMDAADEAARANAADPAGEAVQRMGDPAVVAQGFRAHAGGW